MSKTSIEWSDETWNPVTGCSKVSPGCAHCYAETLSHRFGRTTKPWTEQHEAENVVLHPDRLAQPLRWRKPRMVFVNSMSDLFHEQVPHEYAFRVLDVICRAQQHTFQVLTKRPERMRQIIGVYYDELYWGYPRYGGDWQPLHNLWLGVSIENARFTWRADVLRQIPAAVRFISAEPLLGSLLTAGIQRACDRCTQGVMDGTNDHARGTCRCECHAKRPLDITGIDWLIVGGESGPGARPMRLEWARELIRAAHADDPTGCYCDGPAEDCVGQCHTAVFVKQLGAHPVMSGVEYAASIPVGVECEHGWDVCPTCDAADVTLRLRDRKGGDPEEWPPDLRVREFPAVRERAAA